MNNMRHIGTALRELRKKQKRTLEDVANEVGYDSGNLSKVETGKQTTSDEMLTRLATALGSNKAGVMRRAAELEEEEGYPPVSGTNTNTYAGEPLKQYPEVRTVPVYEGEQLRQLAEDQTTSPDTKGLKHIPAPSEVKPTDFARLVVDDNMTAPPGAAVSYPMGVYAYFDPTLPHRSGDAVLVAIAGGTDLAFTSIQFINGTWMMVPLNPRYPARELPFNSKILAVAFGSWVVTRSR